MATAEVLRARLEQAEGAYHDLTIGGMPRVFVDQNGERIEYQAANSSKLAAYIATLQFQLRSAGTITRPMGVYI